MTTRRDKATPTDTRQVLHRLATRAPHSSQWTDDEQLLEDARSALSTVDSAESFASDGGFDRVRTLVEQTRDPTLREQGESILARFATIQRAVDFDAAPVRESAQSVRFCSAGDNQRST